MSELHPLRDRVLALLAARDAVGLARELRLLHPSDLADVVESLRTEGERAYVLNALPAATASAALAEMEDEADPEGLLASFPAGRISEVVASLDDDDAADLVGDLGPEGRARVLGSLSVVDADDLRRLLAYPEDTAGGLMTTDLVAVHDGLTVAEAIEEVRRQARSAGEFYAVFVTDAQGRLRGTLPLRVLVTEEPGRPVGDVVEPTVATASPETDREEVSRLLSRYDLVSLPVVDDDGRLLGRVTFDDVIDAIKEEATEDLLLFAGTSEDEEVAGPWTDAVRARLPWLGVNLLTAFGAAAVVVAYSGTVSAVPVLAAWMPIVAGMGGNAGTQALAVTVRRLALRQESRLVDRWRAVGKEVLVGLVNGFVIGLATLAVSLVLHQPATLSLVVLAATWGNLAVAGFAGAFVPTLLSRVGVDPAVASSVFVTTFTDVCGFFLLLGLASRLLM